MNLHYFAYVSLTFIWLTTYSASEAAEKKPCKDPSKVPVKLKLNYHCGERTRPQDWGSVGGEYELIDPDPKGAATWAMKWALNRNEWARMVKDYCLQKANDDKVEEKGQKTCDQECKKAGVPGCTLHPPPTCEIACRYD